VYRNRWLDHLVRLMAMTGISTPAFWLGLGVIVLFYGHLQILPGGGRLDDWLDPPTHVTGFICWTRCWKATARSFSTRCST
jgi:peptide/nickel transport system permease protein